MEKCITIGREFGSGGRELGLRLASELHIPFYDKELISLAAEKGTLSPVILEEYEERVFRPAYFSYRPALIGYYQQPISDKIFLEQFHIIKELAEQGPCVIVGRCADYALKDKAVNVFVHADMASRIKRKLEMDIGVPEDKMERHINRVDRKRKSYYRHYTDQIWGMAKNYDLTVDTTDIGVEGAVKVVLAYLNLEDK